MYHLTHCFWQMLKSLQTSVSVDMEVVGSLAKDVQRGKRTTVSDFLLWDFFHNSWLLFHYRDQFCGTLFCSGGWTFPVTSMKSYYIVGNGVTCNEATMKPEDNYPSDLGMVPTGTKCGNNMVRKLLLQFQPRWSGDLTLFFICQVCYNNRCEDIRNIKAYGKNDCSSKCNNHGVRKQSSSSKQLKQNFKLKSYIFYRCVTTRVSVTVTLDGLHLSVMCNNQSWLKVCQVSQSSM